MSYGEFLYRHAFFTCKRKNFKNRACGYIYNLCGHVSITGKASLNRFRGRKMHVR